MEPVLGSQGKVHPNPAGGPVVNGASQEVLIELSFGDKRWTGGAAEAVSFQVEGTAWVKSS